MSRSLKPKNDEYIDSTGIVDDRELLSDILQSLKNRITILENKMTQKPDYVWKAGNNTNKVILTLKNNDATNNYPWLFIASYKDWASNKDHAAIGIIGSGISPTSGTYETPTKLLDPENIIANINKTNSDTFEFNYSAQYSYCAVAAIRLTLGV